MRNIVDVMMCDLETILLFVCPSMAGKQKD